MKKNNICIATWYGPANYGTGLQAIALKYFLENNGFNVYFVEDGRKKEKVENRSRLKKALDKLKQLVNLQFFYRAKYRKDITIKNEMQAKFVNDYDKVFTIHSEEDICELNNITDIFIAGSDQIWNPSVFKDINMLSIANEDKRKISYASSVGVKDIPSEYIDEYTRLLNRFDKISVREQQSREALSVFLNKEIVEVVDPTLLLDSDDWKFLLKEADIELQEIPSKYILCYFVGKNKKYWKYVEKIRKTTDYKVIVLPIHNEAFVNKYDKYVKATPKEFLWLIKNASIICTDSFHATLFSIQFKKEFYVLKRFNDSSKKSQNGRLTNLLKKINLENRLINDESYFLKSSIENYDFILEKLKRERDISKQWLMKAIED